MSYDWIHTRPDEHRWERWQTDVHGTAVSVLKVDLPNKYVLGEPADVLGYYVTYASEKVLGILPLETPLDDVFAAAAVMGRIE